jgi:hypothetical protein
MVLAVSSPAPGLCKPKSLPIFQAFPSERVDTNLGWVHWTKDRLLDLAAGNAKVDLWPDVFALSPKERYPTGFKHADGRRCSVPSKKTPCCATSNGCKPAASTAFSSNASPPTFPIHRYEDLPSDYYLRLTGTATRMLRGEIPFRGKHPTPE